MPVSTMDAAVGDQFFVGGTTGASAHPEFGKYCGGRLMTQAEFDQFDADNPIVWELFVRFTYEAIVAGVTRFSVDSITEKIQQ
jgi:hypothetical protein